MTERQALRELLDDCRARVPRPPSWEDVTADTVRLRVASAYMQSLGTAGLLADELHLAATDQWPADVVAATERLGLYEKYSPTTLRGVLVHLNNQQIKGLVSNVKGTVLEMDVVNRINDGHSLGLPGNPDHAELAPALNQPGWDVQTFTDGQHTGYLQMKQTADWQPLSNHAAKYPHIPDIATSREAVAAAAARGMDTSHLYALSSDAAVTSHVHDALEHLTVAHAANELVPELAIAAIIVGGILRLRAGENAQDTGRWIVEQAATAGAANLAGLAVQAVTGTVVLRPVAALGTRFAIARARVGHAAARHARDLRDQLATLRDLAAQRAYAPWTAPADAPADAVPALAPATPRLRRPTD